MNAPDVLSANPQPADNDGYNAGPVKIKGWPDPLNVPKLMTTPPPPLKEIIPGLLPGNVGLLAAAGSAGKSFLATQTALAVASGDEIAGGLWPVPSITGRAAVLVGEDNKEILHHRLHSMGQVFPSYHTCENISIYPLKGFNKILDVRDGNAFTQGVMRVCEKHVLCVVDPLRRFHRLEENDSADMTALIEFFEYCANQTGCAFLIGHHVNKNFVNGGGSEQAASRGSSALVDAVRCVFNLVPMSEEEAEKFGIKNHYEWVRVVSAKANYLPASQRMTQWLRRCEGGVLVHDEPLSASIVSKNQLYQKCYDYRNND